jgi:hypothetical protein
MVPFRWLIYGACLQVASNCLDTGMHDGFLVHDSRISLEFGQRRFGRFDYEYSGEVTGA